jgi:CRISPR-associated endonuclease/helicase Cas3
MKYKLISHSFDKSLTQVLKLWDHLDQVMKVTRYLVSLKSLNFDGLSKKQIEDICVLIAASHDFGKSTSFFQDYIKSESEKRVYSGDIKEKSHALISAFFGYYMMDKWLLDVQLDPHWKSFLPFAAFVAINGHHSSYKSIDEILTDTEQNSPLLEKQINHIVLEIFEYKFDNIDFHSCIDFGIDKIDDISSKLRKFGRDYKKVPKGYDKDKWLDTQIEHRILALFLYSILLEADKAYLASDNQSQYERNPIPIQDDLIDKYIDEINDNKVINEDRNKAYKETIQRVHSIPLDERIHSITLPTGLGKTLLSASWAIKLRNRISKENNFTPKIIVSLPFLSIIEQTDDEYKKFLKNLYLRHEERVYFPSYSISDFRYRDGIDDQERSKNSIDFFLNTWNAEIIITTYDQLLYSVFSLKPKHLMRFHNLINSIIIFDEVQALPSELWNPFEKFFKKLTEVGSTHILLMSATQPGFMPDAKEKVPNHENYFAGRKRVELHIDPLRECFKGFLEKLPNLLENHADKSMMIVLNTRESSKLVYKEALKLLDNSRPMFYLSSLVTPSQRRERVLKIKDSIKRIEKPLIVTTQCIEAGVDIDVEYVMRDWAPLDSIFQVSGRCNRNGLKELGHVELVNLESDKGKAFSQMIYDNIKLDSTAFSLKDAGLDIREDSFYTLGIKYFKFIQESIGQSMKIVNAYAQYRHAYEDKGKEIAVDIRKLLRDDGYQEQFIVSSLDPELEIKLRETIDIEDRWERRFAIKSLRRRIAANSVNMHFYPWMQVIPDDLTIYKIGNFRILDKRFYDKGGVGLDIDTKEPIGGCIISSEQGL